MTIIETKHFNLRPFTDNDFDILYNIFTDKDVTKLLTPKDRAGTKETLDRYIKRYKEFDITKFAVFTKDTNEFVGGCGFDILHDPENKRNPLSKTKMSDYFGGDLELGYWIYKKFWGKGYATELVISVMKYAFNKFPDLERIVALTDPNNIASQRVLEKCDFEYIQDVESDEYGQEKFYILQKLDLISYKYNS